MEGGGGWGKNQRKIHARENAKKKNSCKEEGKKKFVQKEGPIVTFSHVVKIRKIRKIRKNSCRGVHLKIKFLHKQ